MRQPRTFTLNIFSTKRVSGTTAADYYVNLPGLDALVNGQERPDYYEVTLNRLVGTMNATNSTPAYTGEDYGFIQLALNLPTPFLITNANNNVTFIVPLSGSGVSVQVDGSYFTTEPVIVAASGLSSMLHVQLFDQAGALLDTYLHEHVITLTMREAYVRPDAHLL